MWFHKDIIPIERGQGSVKFFYFMSIMSLIMSFPNSNVEDLSLSSFDVTVFGNSAFSFCTLMIIALLLQYVFARLRSRLRLVSWTLGTNVWFRERLHGSC